MPPYYAQQMASRHHQPILVGCTVTGGTEQLDVTATRSKDGKQIVLHVANIGGRPASATLDIACSGRIIAATASELSGQPEEVNSPESPRVCALFLYYPDICPRVECLIGVIERFFSLCSWTICLFYYQIVIFGNNMSA